MIKYFSAICFTLFFIESGFAQNSIVVAGETLTHQNKDIRTGIMLELKLAEFQDQFLKIFESADSVINDSIYDINDNLIRLEKSTINSNGDSVKICTNYTTTGKIQSAELILSDALVYKETLNEANRTSELFYNFVNEALSFRHTYEYNQSGILIIEQIYDSSNKLVCSIEYTGEQLNGVIFKNFYYYSNDLLSYIISEDFDHNLHHVSRLHYVDGKLDYTIVYNKKGKEIDKIIGG